MARNASQALADAAWCADCTRLGHRCADHATEAMISETLAVARNRLALIRAEYAELLAVARAAVAAERNGDADPLGYIRGVLAERGQLPPDGATAVHVVADARMAMCLAGWSG